MANSSFFALPAWSSDRTSGLVRRCGFTARRLIPGMAHAPPASICQWQCGIYVRHPQRVACSLREGSIGGQLFKLDMRLGACGGCAPAGLK